MSEQPDFLGFCWKNENGQYRVTDPVLKMDSDEIAGWLYVQIRDGRIIGGGQISLANLEFLKRFYADDQDNFDEINGDNADELLKEALKRIFDYASTTGKNRDKELAFVKWYLEAQQAQIARMTERLEKEREAWIDVQRRVQDANDQLRWREDVMERVAALGVKGVDENLGVAAGRMSYMRDSLRAALKGDLSLLEAAERMFSEDKANRPG